MGSLVPPFDPPKTFTEALYNFEFLENSLDLPEWSVEGVFVWKILRVRLFFEYKQFNYLTQSAHPESERLKKKGFKLIKEVPYQLIFQNPFFNTSDRINRVIIPHDRKINIGNQAVDPISYPVWGGKNFFSSLVLDKTSPVEQHILTGVPSFEAIGKITWILRHGIKISIGATDINKIYEISSFLGYSDQNNFKKRILKTIKLFLASKKVFTALLKKVNPSYLYLVVSYGKEAYIAASQELGIETIEFQHGSIGRGHMGYDFKNWDDVPYFPNRMLAFGKKWFFEPYFPKSCKINPVGVPYIEDSVKRALQNNSNEDRNKQLLVLSQGTISKELLNSVIEFCKLRPDWNIVVRPHPSESEIKIKSYFEEYLYDYTHYLVVDKDTSLFDQAAKSTIVFGVYSTAIVECLLAGCKVVLLEIEQEAQYLNGLVNEGQAFKVYDGKELAGVIDKIPKGSARGYFEHPVRDIASFVETNKDHE